MTNTVNNKAVLWRLAIPVIILILSTICFEAGVVVEHRPDIAREGLFMHVLYAMSLFKVNGINLGMPVQGPIWAIDILFLMYLAAPAVSVSAILEAVFRVARLKLRWVLMRGGHAVVVGSGRATTDLPAIIDSEVASKRWYIFWKKKIPIVFVDKSEDALLRNSTRHLKMQLDATDPAIVDILNMKNARIVMLVTGSDQANIDMYFKLREELITVPEEDRPQVFIRVRDTNLLQVLRAYNTTPKTRFFNVHIEAVRSLFVFDPSSMQSEWLTELRQVSPALCSNWDALGTVKDLKPQRIVMLGFGRFGQHLLVEMIVRNKGSMVQKLQSLAIVSPEVMKEWVHFERLLLCNVQSDVVMPIPELTAATHNDVGLLHSLAQDSKDVDTLYIIGTDDTSANIQAASFIQRFCASQAHDDTAHSTIMVRTNMFSMAHERLLHSGASSNVDYVILPTYHVLGAYFSRRMREGA